MKTIKVTELQGKFVDALREIQVLESKLQEDVLINCYVCVLPSDEMHQSAQYDFKSGEKIKNLEFPEKYSVLIVNDSEYNIGNVKMLAGGFASQDDGVLETSKNLKEFGQLKSHQMILLETLDFGMLDFVNWYHIDLFLEDTSAIKIEYEIHFLNEDWLKIIPVINKKGYEIPFKLRKTELIEEEVIGMSLESKFTKTSD